MEHYRTPFPQNSRGHRAATTPIPDLVQVSQLDTQFNTNPKYTQHIKYVSSRTTRERGTRKEEKWKRERRLGRGGFGVVWLERCIQGDSKGEVRAVKKVPKFEDSNCYRELEAIALFSHTKYEECFVKSYGWYDDDDSIFITMEYLPDGDLQKYLNVPLPEKEGQHIVSQILQGLRFMHERGFAHRDLKPANILIASKGPDWWVKIADFGISKRATEGVTAFRTQICTPAFAAPEVQGFLPPGDKLKDSYTNAVDIWALGVIAFLILTGKTFFTDPSRLGQYVAGSCTFPSDVLLANKVSVQGCEFVRSLMAPNSEHRPGAKDCLQHPWLTSLKDALESEREISVFKSLPTSLDYSDPEPSASWSTQKQPLTHKTQISIDALAHSVSTNTIASSMPESGIYTYRKTFREHENLIWAVAFSPDGKQIASASYYEVTVRLWDSATGALRNTLKGHKREIRAVAFSPDGKQIASASYDKTIRLWDSITGALRNKLKGHWDSIEAVAFSPDGKQIASASNDMTIRLWDSATGTLRDTLRDHKHWINAVAFSPDGKQIASASADMTIRLWDSATGVLRDTLEDHKHWVNAVAFSPDGKQIASASHDKTIRLWDSATGALRDTLEGHKHWVNAVAFSPDGKQIASASADMTIRLWDSATGTLRDTLEDHKDWVNAVAFSPDGKQIVSASHDKTIRLWDSITEASRGTLEDHKN